jgi:hypothetical protein
MDAPNLKRFAESGILRRGPDAQYLHVNGTPEKLLKRCLNEELFRRTCELSIMKHFTDIPPANIKALFNAVKKITT